jgi:hypothetical protein
VAYSRYYPSICAEGYKNAIRNLSCDIWCPGRDSNRDPSEYKSTSYIYTNLSVTNTAVYVRY